MKIRKTNFSRYGKGIVRGAGVVAVLTAAFFAVNALESHAVATVSFKDFSALKGATVPAANQLSRLYYTDTTKITVAKVAGDATEGQVIFDKDATTVDNSISNITTGEKLNVLIKNSSAKDAKGNPLDVVVSVGNVHLWNTGVDDEGKPISYAGISFPLTFQYADSNTIITTDTETETANVHNYAVGAAGTPIIFWMNNRYVDEQVSVRYFVKDSYKVETDTGTMAGITDVSMMAYDFDVPLSQAQRDEYGGQLMFGNEGIRFDTGTTSAYYDMATTGGDDGFTMNANEDSFWATSAGTAAFNGVYYKDSIFSTTTGLNDEFKFTYSAGTAGIGVAIASAVPYATEAPVKTVNKEKAYPGAAVNYTIKQTIPENAYSEADYHLFGSLNYAYNYFTNKTYKALAITDTFDKNLSLAASSITVKDEKGADASALFGVAVDTTENKVTATARDASAAGLYGHTFTVTVPATILTTTGATTISNVATTMARYENDLNRDVDLDLSLNSNTVSTAVEYTYEIVFNANKEGATGTMANETCKRDVDCVLTANTYQVNGSKFKGWNTAADGSGTSYTDAATVKNLAEVGKSITLYAQWEASSSKAAPAGEASGEAAKATPTPTPAGAKAPDTGALSMANDSYAERAAMPIAAIVFAPVAVWIVVKVVRSARKKKSEWYDNWE